MAYDRSLFITRNPVEGVAFDTMASVTGLLHDKLFPHKVVKASLTKVPQFDTSKLRVPKTDAKTDALAPKIDEQLFYRDITLEEHKLSKDVNPRDVRDADQPGLIDDMRAAKVVTLGLLLQRESKAATLATTVANYPSDLTSAKAAGSYWTDPDGDPESDAVTAHNAMVLRCGTKANAVSMSGTTFRKLKLSPSFRDRIKYTTGGPVSQEAVKAFFDVENLFLTDNTVNTALEGAASSISDLWGANVIFHVYNPNPDMEAVSYGHTFLMNAPFWSKTIIDEKRQGAAGPMREVQVGCEYVINKGIVVSSADSDFAGGYLFRTVVA